MPSEVGCVFQLTTSSNKNRGPTARWGKERHLLPRAPPDSASRSIFFLFLVLVAFVYALTPVVDQA